MSVAYRPDLLYLDGSFVSQRLLVVSADGRIERVAVAGDADIDHVIDLHGKALLPGLVNAHSHAFQRLIRGKAESRAVSGHDFWSWRGTMYHAAAQLSPADVYDVARMVFLEMLFAGITTLGEFHYLHTDPGGRPYDDPNLLARQVITAAQSVGLRIVLLRSAYQRAGYQLPPDPGQRRFYESTQHFLSSMEELLADNALQRSAVHLGVAPHSIRALRLEAIAEITGWARQRSLPVHMHVAEQRAENDACMREYGATPVALLANNGILHPGFTGVHTIHTSAEELEQFAASGATICSCPTTERNLGDGILAADRAMTAGIRIALGSDSQAQIDSLEDARELDYHLRLRDEQRAITDQIDGVRIAERLFTAATRNGAEALHIPAGRFIPGTYADAFTVDLHDIAVAGHGDDDLLPMLVFALNRTAIRDVFVHGTRVLTDQQHPLQQEIVARYRELHDRVWGRVA
jgi:formimidoylglutamate deiminase